MVTPAAGACWASTIAIATMPVPAGVALPHRHRMCHQLAHRRLEVIVADGPARYAGRTRANSALVEHEDVPTPAEPAGPQLPGQVPSRGQPVDARADDDVPAMSADHGTRLSIKGARQHRIHATARVPPAGRHGDGGELPGPVRTERYSPERAGCLLPHNPRGHRQARLASSLRTAFSAWSRVARSPKSQSLPSSPSAEAIVRPSSYRSMMRGSI
jgi:hypothetical protein